MKVTERECVTQLERKKIEIPSHMHYFADKNRLFQKNIFSTYVQAQQWLPDWREEEREGGKEEQEGKKTIFH